MSWPQKPLVVGLTGPIGAGKSAVAGLLSKKGLPIIDADTLGRDVVETAAHVKTELAAAFGTSIFTAAGGVDRLALARAAFETEEATRRLNAIVHPLLWTRVKSEVASYPDADVVVIDAALIVEWGATLPVDVVVVVDAPEAVRKKRSRRKYDEKDFYARQGHQLDARRKRARADVIIDNAGSQRELEKKVDRLYLILKETACGKPLRAKPVII
jgi:dephospho-CoA kinase